MNHNLSVYEHRFNLLGAAFSQVQHEDAIVAVVYKVTQQDGTQLILKICNQPNHFYREVYFLKHFAGRSLAPRLVESMEPSNGIDGAVLMECLPGSVLKIADYTDGLAFEMGLIMARIHLNHASGYGDLIDLKGLKSDPRANFTLKFEESLDECDDHLPLSLINQCRSYYDTHMHLFRSVDGPCIVHRDFRPGNVMVEKGKIQGVIDWSSGSASFAEEDFCCMEHGEWSRNSGSKKAFLAGYASVRAVPEYATIMPLLRLCKSLAVIGYLVKKGTWESSQAKFYRFNRQFLDTFFNIQSRA